MHTIFGDLSLAAEAGGGAGPGAEVASGAVTVLVRPEQLEVRERAGANGASESGVAGRVVACEYYGHDAVLRVRPGAAVGVPEIIVRIAGGPSLPPGADVLVHARGPVLAWPR